ncbi:MAG TPA: formate--tetrahydrofolate ligase, partial [Planctomycetota bacterium]|nr:formate--tetrahydrofolate ligase [Planctomycetota bacterium]
SHDKAQVGRPIGFELPIRDLRLQSGAGFVVAYAGDVMTMPGLGSQPAYRRIELLPDGTIEGLL